MAMLLRTSVATILFATFSLLSVSSAWAKSLSVSSPDKKITVTIDDGAGAPVYSVSFNGAQVVSPSVLGLEFREIAALGEGFAIASHEITASDSHWQQPWGERQQVRDNHRQLLVHFSDAATSRDESPRRFSVRFRVFNDGLGFRYEIPQQGGQPDLTITNELTEFRIEQPGQTDAWWIPARGWNRYEYLYRSTPLADIDRAHTPLTFRLNSGVHLSIHEAALVDYAAMALDQRRPGQLKADLAPWSDGSLVKTRAPFHTPWRTIQIAEQAVGLVNSDLILNLNEPNKLGDVSWVKPGKYVGIWWAMHLQEKTWHSGDRHGATTEETKRYMDFAAQNGFDGVLVEGWNRGWEGPHVLGDNFNFTQSYEDFDLHAVTDYGREKGVELIGHHETNGSVSNYARQMKDALDLYQDLGVRQIKTGYVADGGKIKRIDENGIVRYEWHDGQYMVNEYLRNITEAAKRKISINTHEPVKDTGLRRTYPNWVSREGARGQEFNAWGSPPNPPEHTALLPFTRMLSGPMDFTPGIFDLSFNGLDGENRPRTTLAKQLALYLVLYSPIQMAADLPRNYLARPDAFQFIRDVPTDWAESRALQGEVGDFIAIARKDRNSENWYLGALTDEVARTLTIPLDFLEPGIEYQAEIYRDGKKTDWKTNPYDLAIDQKAVSSKDTLKLSLAASGGTAIRFVAGQ